MAPRRGLAAGSVERIDRICREPVADRPLRMALLAELRRGIGFDWHAWLLTDPETEVGSAPLADTPSVADLPRLIRAKYLTALNRWTSLGATPTSLQRATGGDLDQSLVWREVLSGYGISDVASMAFRDAYGCWGFLDLWRTPERGPFEVDELRFLEATLPPMTAALRNAQARTFTSAAPPPERHGPVVLMLSAGLEVKAQTPDTEAYLRTLIPPDGERRPIPAGAYNVAAQLLAVEAGTDDHPPSSRVHLDGGTWLMLRAARVDAAGEPSEQDIAVTIEPAPPTERRDLYARAHGLSPRERELLDLLADGAYTRTIAAELFVSEHTVQDHLKSIFAKTGTRNRRTLVTRLAGR